jgi:putative photosynthetic complex assembly protein
MQTHSDSPLGHGTPWPIWAVGGLLALTLAVVTWQSQIAGGPVKEDLPSVQWQRSLRFEDRPNGDIAVLDATTQREVAHFQGEQGFLRGSLRALARERQRRGIGPQMPFELTGHVDGRITLRDTATGQRIALESFGPTNSAVFSQLQWAR